ncbi:hypothetical protein Q4Q39_15155 [Flavivirga amylovorans]|uniref:Uncharacterized protein n=1 Tax=Flavivirga amylovorans TaxID=870486 RepID=A0ABT8X5C1_9FLAO|nr:hypothetical protein [Flavivirga amylovorans]MDO5988749.1 hypothetical protein [Flavivirga amylovorans]
MIETINKYIEVWNTQTTEKLQDIFTKTAFYKDALQNGNAIDIMIVVNFQYN